MLNEEVLNKIKNQKGFIAAIDNSDVSVPYTLTRYGIPDVTYNTSDEMHRIVHDMRMRMLLSDSFSSEHILAVILCKDTLERTIFNKKVSQYITRDKGMSIFLKIDDGLAPMSSGVQLFKQVTKFEDWIKKAKENNIIGMKSRSLILEANEDGIKEIVTQQIELAKSVHKVGFLPMLEPDIGLHIRDKKQAELYLKKHLIKEIRELPEDMFITLKLTLPVEADFYHDLLEFPQVIRIMASSSGLGQTEADNKLSQNHDMIASFSRALNEGLTYDETDFEYEMNLANTIKSIYEASNT